MTRKNSLQDRLKTSIPIFEFWNFLFQIVLANPSISKNRFLNSIVDSMLRSHVFTIGFKTPFRYSSAPLVIVYREDTNGRRGYPILCNLTVPYALFKFSIGLILYASAQVKCGRNSAITFLKFYKSTLTGLWLSLQNFDGSKTSLSFFCIHFVLNN